MHFVDIDCLMVFQEIESVHSSKIYAYLVYWILRHKPIQIMISENAPDLAFQAGCAYQYSAEHQ